MEDPALSVAYLQVRALGWVISGCCALGARACRQGTGVGRLSRGLGNEPSRMLWHYPQSLPRPTLCRHGPSIVAVVPFHPR